MNILETIWLKFQSIVKSKLCVMSIIDKHSIYLTFDDGPEPSITEFVLDQLCKYDAKATFFCVGDNIGKYPELYQNILNEGHTIASHTMTHVNGCKTNLKCYYKEVSVFCKKYGTKLLRPPYGAITFPQLFLLKCLGYTIVLWSVDSTDWCNSKNIDFDIDNILSKIRPGSIILLHSCKKHEHRTKKILPIILREMSKRKLTFKAL